MLTARPVMLPAERATGTIMMKSPSLRRVVAPPGLIGGVE